MRNSSLIRLIATTAMTTFVAGCSGGGGSPAGTPAASLPPPPPPPVTMSIATIGTITGFGSIFVNGVKYEVDSGTVVSVEDEPDISGDNGRLRLGMKVEVEATETSGVRTASRFKYDEDIKGAAEAIIRDPLDPAIGSFSVAGQTVIVDTNTVFDNNIGNNDSNPGIDLGDLDPGNFPGNVPIVVEVSGFITDTGIVATRIERVGTAFSDLGRQSVDGDEVEVKGVVDAFDLGAGTFTINGAIFAITSSTIFADGLVGDGTLVNTFVEVKADIGAAGGLIAVRVEREDDLSDFRADDEFEIEGILQSIDTTSQPHIIVVNGFAIQVQDAASLVSRIGLRVEIKGSFDSNGLLIIRESEIEVENSVRTEDKVTSIDIPASFLETRLGLTISPSGGARLEDEVVDGDRLSVQDFISRLRSGDTIEARGFPLADGTVTWTRIERSDETEPKCRLRGAVEAGSISDPTFIILGVLVDTTGLSFGGFEDASDLDIGRSEFFSNLQAGDVVQATSDDAGLGCNTGVLATQSDGQVEFEPDDGIAGTSPTTGADNNGGGANQIAGTVANVDASALTFEIAGRSVIVSDATLIDASLVERARGVELGPEDLRFGDLPEMLDQLIRSGDVLRVTLDAAGIAIQIEDVS